MNFKSGLAAALLAVLFVIPQHSKAQLVAARVVATCGTVSPTPHAGATYALTMDVTGTLCSGSGGGTFTWPGTAGNATGGTTTTGTMPYVNAYIVGGGTGLSVPDTTTFTAATSPMTPMGCEAITGGVGPTVTTGNQVMAACSLYRAASIDTPTTNNNLYTAITSAVPAGTNLIGGVSPTPYPIAAVPITASATGTTAATTATLTAVTAHTTYLCGFSIRANATAAATGNATVTGTITATMNFTQWTAPLASGLGVTEEVFSPCVPASAVSTSIAVVSAAPGTGGVVSVSAWGYSL